MASCILLKCAAWWKCEAMSLVSSVASTLAKVNRMRQAMTCAHTGKSVTSQTHAVCQRGTAALRGRAVEESKHVL